MPCTEPLSCWVHGTTENGKDKYVFRNPGTGAEEQKVPCGKCLSCLIDKSKEWATRGFHESQCHLENCFITLTYNDQHLPEHSTLVKEHLTRFIKRLRERIKPIQIKFLAAGEYGSAENTHRPHYHLCIFGFAPMDKKYLFTNKHGDPVFTSDFIEQCWKDKDDTEPKGYITVSELNYRTVAYVARYTVKKIVPRGKRKQEKFWIDTETGETNYDPEAYRYNLLMQNKIPEYITMSNGIGKEWHKRHITDTHKDYITVNYMKAKIPRYYDKLMEEKDPERLEAIKEKRIAVAKELERSDQENKQAATIKENQIKRLNRSL
jgi:hypothetical protein